MIFVLLITLVTGCAKAPQLTKSGSLVREISKQDAETRECKFIKTINYQDRLFSVGKTPMVMKAVGEANIQNMVGNTGATHYVILKSDSDWFLGAISYRAEAYICK